jgi:hypothetical protein
MNERFPPILLKNSQIERLRKSGFCVHSIV